MSESLKKLSPGDFISLVHFIASLGKLAGTAIKAYLVLKSDPALAAAYAEAKLHAPTSPEAIAADQAMLQAIYNDLAPFVAAANITPG